jgi:hypothetical protein
MHVPQWINTVVMIECNMVVINERVFPQDEEEGAEEEGAQAAAGDAALEEERRWRQGLLERDVELRDLTSPPVSPVPPTALPIVVSSRHGAACESQRARRATVSGIRSA